MAGKKTKKTGRTVQFRKLASPIVTVALFVAAAAMLLGSTIGGTRAALQFYSASYLSNVSLKYIGVSLMESNGYTDASGTEKYERVAWRNYDADGVWDRTDSNLAGEGVGTLLTNLLGTGEDQDKAFKIGRNYTEKLAVANTGTIDTYVRVIVTKYWAQPQKDRDGNVLRDEDGNAVMMKATQLDPEMIDLHWINTEGDGAVWLIDEEASTPERTVLYYRHILKAMEETADGQQLISMTEPLCDMLTVKGEISNRVTQETVSREEGGRIYTTITTTYDYDGTEFVVEAEVDAVQTHSAEAAIWSAWGRRVSVDDATKDLSLTVDRTADTAPESETAETTEAAPETETAETPGEEPESDGISVPEAASAPAGA